MHDLPVSVNVIRAGVANPYAFTMYLGSLCSGSGGPTTAGPDRQCTRTQPV